VTLSACTRHSERLGDRQAGDGHPLASSRISLVLAMEVAFPRRQTEGPARNPSVDPRHEPRQPALRRSADPTANSSNSALMWVKPRSPSIWLRHRRPRRKGGRSSCATTPVVLPQWISLLFQGCANAAAYSGRWANLCEPNSRRITSSVRSDLIYDRDKDRGRLISAFIARDSLKPRLSQ
jgi:hypothetical protein